MSEFVVGTYNLHVNAVKKNPDQIFKDIKELLATCHVLNLQEAGQAGKIIDRVIADGKTNVHFGTTESSRSTPILYHASLIVVKTGCVPLTGRTDTNEPSAAGPTVIKAKDLNYVTFRYNARFVTDANIHTTPSIWAKNHKSANAEQVRDAAEALTHIAGVKFISGDWNQIPTSKLLKPLKHAKMYSSQKHFGFVGTEGKRPIDDIYYLDDRARVAPIKRKVFNGISDHRGYIVFFEIKPRKYKKFQASIV